MICMMILVWLHKPILNMVPKAQAAQIRFDSELKERKGIQIHVSTNMFNEFGELAFVMPC